MDATIRRLLDRSNKLDKAVWRALPDPLIQGPIEARRALALTAALIAVEQARACRLLISEGMHTTAIAVNRVQFEALCRSLWLLYSATEEEVANLAAPLSPETERLAKSLPMAAKMVEALEGQAPKPAVDMLAGYKDAMLGQLHSFLHVGVHPLARHVAGYPVPLLAQIIGNANGIYVATGAMLSILSGSQEAMSALSRLQREYSDCLPALISASQPS